MKICYFIFFILISQFLFGQTKHLSITIKNKTNKELNFKITSTLPRCPSMYVTTNKFLNPLFYDSVDSNVVLDRHSVITLLSCEFEGISIMRINDYLQEHGFNRWKSESYWTAIFRIKEENVSFLVRRRGLKYMLVYK